MSESSGEKTEEPTDKKLKDGRKKGQVVKSQDIDKLFITAAGFEIVIALSDVYLNKITSLISLATNVSMRKQDFLVSVSILATQSFTFWFASALPVIGIVIVAKLLASFCQHGFVYAPEAMKIDMKKLSPVANGKNLISKKKIVEFFGTIAKAFVLVMVVYNVVMVFLPDILLSAFSTLDISMDIGVTVGSYILRISMIVFIVIGVTDFILQKKIFIKSMKMTKDEVFREYKQSEGDPEINSARKSLAKELASSRGESVAKKVEQSDAVVVNPTHFAVALEYKAGKTPLPVIRCKGVDGRAQDIIKYAKQHNVPVIRYVPLARELFHKGQEGKFIPRATLVPVASVFKVIKETIALGRNTSEVREIR